MVRNKVALTCQNSLEFELELGHGRLPSCQGVQKSRTVCDHHGTGRGDWRHVDFVISA